MNDTGTSKPKIVVQRRMATNKYMAILQNPDNDDVLARCEELETEREAWLVANALRIGFETGASIKEV